MSNIQLHKPITHVNKNGEIVPVQSLAPVEQLIVNTYSNPTIRKYTENELLLSLNDVLTACYVDLGYKQPQTDQEKTDRANEILIMVRSIAEELRDKFYNSLRVNEVKTAIKKGSLGNYNTKEWQFIGVNVANVIKSIRAYLSDIQRNQEITTYMKLTAITEKKEPTDKEKFDLMKSNALKAFELFQQKKDINLYSLLVYEFLDSLGLIEFDAEEKKDFMVEGKQLLLKELEKSKASSTNLQERRMFEAQIQSIIEDNQKELVIVKAKKLALKAYFQCVILEEENLELLLNEKFDNKKDSL